MSSTASDLKQPWKSDSMGIVRDADGALIGAAHFAFIGQLDRVQSIARHFAAAGILAAALTRLRRSEQAYIFAKQSGLMADELRPHGVEWSKARRAADDALKLLDHPITGAKFT